MPVTCRHSTMVGHAMVGKAVDDPVKFLDTLRQLCWRGQSYSAIYRHLSRLLFAKIYAEKNYLEFNRGSLSSIMSAVMGCDKVDFKICDELGEAIDYLSDWRIAHDRTLLHVMHRAWLESALRKENGQYYTPGLIKRFMTAIYPPKYDGNICDPCGGSAGFLIEAADAMESPAMAHFYYFDIDRDVADTARLIMAMYEHRTGVPLISTTITAMDSLANDWPCLMSNIYTNVPFGLRLSADKLDNNGISLLRSFKTGAGKSSESSQILFIEKCLNNLEYGGTFATVVDKGVVTNIKLRNERRLLFDNGRIHLELVVELPHDAFAYAAGTEFQTYLLFFRSIIPGIIDSKYTYFYTIRNPGYNGSGYVVNGHNAQGFPYSMDDEAWGGSDWPVLLDAFRNKSSILTAVPSRDVAEGDWHAGAHRYRSYAGTRLRDVAELVDEPWDGRNPRNPSIDRQFMVITEARVAPSAKKRMLRQNCLLMNRLIADNNVPRCAIITADYDGAGCTVENYIIRPKNIGNLILLWYLINFHASTIEYLISNGRGLSRGRVLENDFMNMPIPDIDHDTLNKATRLASRLFNKSHEDALLLSDINRLATNMGDTHGAA